jgi:uncharacterized protein with HEPN domain
MKRNDRDISTLKHIVFYCDEIDDEINRHGLTLEKVKADSLYKNALAMNILQIGELVNVLSEEFRALSSGSVPWREIKRMRDKAAHHYGSFDIDTLWETATDDIAQLRVYCSQCVEELGKQPSESDSKES